MKAVKEYIQFAVYLLIYLIIITALLRSYFVYQNAYQNLSRLISHTSIESIEENNAMEGE